MSNTKQRKLSISLERHTNRLFQHMGYTFGKTIGQGTYSKVCVVTTDDGSLLACKIINKKKAGGEFIAKFLPRELTIVSAIKHPNIVTVYKILEINKIIYMFMDYCKNGDLLEYIRISGYFSELKAKHYFRQIVAAVYYLHKLDIAHRDLKCENIFLVEDHQVKLGDFGFARGCITQSGSRVMSNTFCGSAAYAAPEILQGIAYDPKKYDIWALGCILYIMLCASMPFDDSNLRKMVQCQQNQIINTITTTWTTHSRECKTLISFLLEPDPSRRINIKQVSDYDWLEEDGK